MNICVIIPVEPILFRLRDGNPAIFFPGETAFSPREAESNRIEILNGDLMIP